MSERICSIDSCERPHKAKGLCDTHYNRRRRDADLYAAYHQKWPTLEAAFLAHLTPGTNDCILWTGSQVGQGYGRVNGGGLSAYAHRYAWERANGPILHDLEIDHTCRIHLCVNVEHLRLATHKQNHENRVSTSATSKSGVRGVQWNKQHGKWHVEVKHNQKKYFGGLFTDLSEAAAAAAALRAQLFTHSLN